jgi:serine protease Do
MKNLKFGAFVLGLALTVGGAVSTLAAQNRFEVRPGGRADVMVLGPGSQLGVQVSDTANGVRVDDVNEGSPAEKAGVRDGDLIVEFDGERVRSARQLMRLVQETPEGRRVSLAVMRDGTRQTLQATPEEGRFTFNARPDLPHFNFDFDDLPRRFDFRLPAPGSRFPESRGRLGVTVQSLTPDLEEYFGATNGGVLVSSVRRDSAAAKAGLRAGDVITSVNGDRVRDAGDLTQELEDASGEVTIVVLRDRKEMTLKAPLRSR